MKLIIIGFACILGIMIMGGTYLDRCIENEKVEMSAVVVDKYITAGTSHPNYSIALRLSNGRIEVRERVSAQEYFNRQIGQSLLVRVGPELASTSE
jgi:hypothetical protein